MFGEVRPIPGVVEQSMLHKPGSTIGHSFNGVVYAQLPLESKSSEWRCCACCTQHCCCRACGIISIVLLVLFPIFKILTLETSLPSAVPVLPEEMCVDEWPALLCSLRSAAGRRDGWCTRTSTGCAPYDAAEEAYYKEIRNDEVEHEMSYAKRDSGVPESLQGIWWMDQQGLSLPLPGDPDYPYWFYPTREVLISFGDDAVWDPVTNCLSRVPFYTGRGGHWTAYNLGGGVRQWEMFRFVHLTLDFCFTDATQTKIQIWQRLKPPLLSVLRPLLLALGFMDAGQGYIYLPSGIVSMIMTKTPWGWSRQSNILGSWLRSEDTREALARVLPWPFLGMAEWGLSWANGTQFYPVLQIVDGDGNRTEHYKTYLEKGTSYKGRPSATQILALRRPGP